MRTELRATSIALLVSSCVAAPDGLDASEQETINPAQRVFNIVEAVLPAGNHDGIPGDECVALLDPEHRLRKVILVERTEPGATCMLPAFVAGNAMSFTWGDTERYNDAAGVATVRAALSDDDGAVHYLVGNTTSEAAALAALQAFLVLPDATQATQIQTFTAKRVHSLFDFDGDEEVLAEAAFQAVRVQQPCENPGAPRLDAYTFNGYVHGYIASNTGSCHSGWFSKRHVYNRDWRRVATIEQSE